MHKRFVFALLLCLPAGAARAEVRPHGLFTDGAVLQQGMRVPVWGTAGDGEKVTVSIQGHSVSTAAKDGRWSLYLPPLRSGGPFTLSIRGDNRVEARNVLVGEVWVCSGQSNMEWSITRSANPEQTIAGSADAMLRLLTIARATSETPVREVTAAWKECGPETVPGFSAVAYHFGRHLRKSLNVPVGLINTSWGGTYAEAWTSHETLAGHPELRHIPLNYHIAKRNYPLAQIVHRSALEQHRLEVERATREGRAPPPAPAAPANPANPASPNRPSVLYNAMIAPLIPYAIRGAIWYQGESNAGRAHQYQTLFPEMIRNWRRDWSQGDFPFLFVQLAPFMAIQPEPMESAWAELREAQRLTSLRLPNAGMAVITDAGEERDIHPKDKQTVGTRLALAARAIAYGEKIEGSGPVFERMVVEDHRAVLSFRHTEGGLVAKGDRLTGFTIAGEDRRWHAADAEIRGNRVVVSSPRVASPVAVRYGWANFPVVNLYNGAGIPASPFRTDDFPLTTGPQGPAVRVRTSGGQGAGR